MNIQKILTIVAIIWIVILVGFVAFHLINHSNSTNKVEEYTPQEEMSDDEMRKTIVSLYFKNIDTNSLVPESTTIDVKELAENPYQKLIELLLSGPSNEKLECPLPENTKINNAYLKDGIVYLDFSLEFIENAPSGAEEESLIIYSIVNTLTELNEVSGVKILVNGDENLSFNDGAMNFKEVFVRND